MEYLFYYILKAPNKNWVNANKAQNIPVTISFFKNGNNLTGAIILNYLILIVVIIFWVKSFNHYELSVKQ